MWRLTPMKGAFLHSFVILSGNSLCNCFAWPKVVVYNNECQVLYSPIFFPPHRSEILQGYPYTWATHWERWNRIFPTYIWSLIKANSGRSLSDGILAVLFCCWVYLEWPFLSLSLTGCFCAFGANGCIFYGCYPFMFVCTLIWRVTEGTFNCDHMTWANIFCHACVRLFVCNSGRDTKWRKKSDVVVLRKAS